MKKEGMFLQESKEGYIGQFGGRKGEEKCIYITCNYITISNIKEKKYWGIRTDLDNKYR